MPHIDLVELVKTWGYYGLVFIVFSENGLFFGFFFPGDSLLFTAGLLASQNWFNVWVLIPILIVAAIAGMGVGYWTGGKFGSWLLKQKDTWFFKKHYLVEARAFYDKHGGKAVLLARFVPIVRTFVPIVAGVAEMNYSKFMFYNVVGGTIWVTVMTLLGYYLGLAVPQADTYLLPIILGIVILSILPGVVHMRRNRGSK
ncbi:hypothetical protein A3B57_00145 [Microgenomates group bacterium RIFCSPLOWO2_01_FULL_47_10]|nr:MAG: hypothetical protein A3B57_00145 [Microgenomates group bacterium RIFCSPLOWO2_01_FULL_47_10]